MPTSFAVVLQMPRGNLETVYPRALVVGRIRECIAAKDYRSAFFACRNQRVDMNILHDYIPKQFISNVGIFIDQVGKVEHVDLFLSQLRSAQASSPSIALTSDREEDVTKTMYRTTLPKDVSNPVDASTGSAVMDGISSSGKQISKVNSICDAFLASLTVLTPKHLQNIVTAHVSKLPPDLDSALQVIVKLRGTHPDSLWKLVL